MRALTIVLLMLAAALAGCLDGEETLDGSDDDNDEPPMEDVPEALHFEGSGTAVGDAATGMGNLGCTTGDAACTYHTFSLDRTWSTTLTLVGTPGPVSDAGAAYYGTDYDLFLYDSSGTLVGSSTEPSGTEDVVSASLAAGEYTAEVVAWHDIDGSYTLAVEFAAP